MNSIQIILVSCITLIAGYAVYSFNRNRWLVVLSFIATTLIIIFPDELTIIARIVGVRRGVDLLFYLSFTLLIFILVKFYKKIKYLERKLTEVVRQIAITKIEKY